MTTHCLTCGANYLWWKESICLNCNGNPEIEWTGNKDWDQYIRIKMFDWVDNKEIVVEFRRCH